MARQKLSEEQRYELATLYLSGMTLRAVSRTFGVSRASAAGVIRRRGGTLRGQTIRSHEKANRANKGVVPNLPIRPRRWPLDETVFDTLNENSRYWVGFLMADGSVTRNRLSLHLAARDVAHLRKLRRFLHSKTK